MVEKLQKQIADLQAEIERLKQIVGFTPARGSRKSPLLNAVLDNVRAEAVKEFAERLKDMSEHFWEEKENFVSEEQIDNLLKELVGEDDG